MKREIPLNVFYLLIIIMFISGCTALTSLSKQNMGSVMGFKYAMSVSRMLPDNKITSYSLSHSGSMGRIIGRGASASPGHDGGQYMVVSDLKLNYFLDSSLKDNMVEVRIESSADDSDHVQLYWQPNPLPSRGALIYELIQCKGACESQSKASLHAGVIAGPIQLPIQIPIRGSGHYGIKLYQFDTMVPRSPWVLFQAE